MKKLNLVAMIASVLASVCAAAPAAAQAEIRLGIIGTDTSHVTAFTKLLNDAFMEAADLSKARGGASVALAEVTQRK